MASGSTKGAKKKVPRTEKELIKRINKRGHSFIRAFDNQEPNMSQIAKEFDKIAAKLKQKLEEVGDVSIGGIGLATVKGLVAPFIGGMAAAGLAVASAAAPTLLKKQLMAEDEVKLESLRNNYMEIINPLMDDLKEIKELCETLEEKPGRVKKMEEFQRLRDEVNTVSSFVFDEAEGMMESINKLLKLFQEENKTLMEMIVKSGEKCKKLIREFGDVKEALEDFRQKTAVSRKCSIL